MACRHENQAQIWLSNQVIVVVVVLPDVPSDIRSISEYMAFLKLVIREGPSAFSSSFGVPPQATLYGQVPPYASDSCNLTPKL